MDAKDDRIDSVFDIPLTADLREMAEMIARWSGHAIHFYKTTNPNAYEECGFENHIPSVGLRDPEGLNPYNVAHGLCHLRCRLRGYPTSVTTPQAEDQFLVSNTCSDLQSLIEHRIIYPELEIMGFDPKNETETILKAFKPEHFNKEARRRPEIRRQLPLIYARIVLEIRAGSASSKAETWFLQTDREARRTGRKIVSLIRNGDLSNAKGYMKVFDECMALLDIPPEAYSWAWEVRSNPVSDTASLNGC